MCRAAAPSRLLIRPDTAAVTSPARGNSFRLIVKVSIGGRHFHGAVTPRHFYVAAAILGFALTCAEAPPIVVAEGAWDLAAGCSPCCCSWPPLSGLPPRPPR